MLVTEFWYYVYSIYTLWLNRTQANEVKTRVHPFMGYCIAFLTSEIKTAHVRYRNLRCHASHTEVKKVEKCHHCCHSSTSYWKTGLDFFPVTDVVLQCNPITDILTNLISYQVYFSYTGKWRKVYITKSTVEVCIIIFL